MLKIKFIIAYLLFADSTLFSNGQKPIPEYDPDRGVLLDVLDIPSIGTRCSIYLVSNKALYLEACNRESFQGLQLHYDKELITDTSISDVPNGVVLHIHLGHLPLKVVPHLSVSEPTVHRGSGPGTIDIPLVALTLEKLIVPKEIALPKFSSLAHGLRSGNIIIMNTRTFYIQAMHYDGNAPDAYFWVGNGKNGPDSRGRKVPDEKNSTAPIEKYSGENILIILPEDTTVHEIDYFGVWCVKFGANFGYVDIPKHLVVPPSFYLDIEVIVKPPAYIPQGSGVQVIRASSSWFSSMLLVISCLVFWLVF